MAKSKFVQWVERSIVDITTEDVGDITSIGAYAFQYCTRLTSINIPDSVTEIRDWVFRGCSSLTSITSLNPTPPTIQLDTLWNVPVTCKITVPYQSVSAYRSAQYWSYRANYIEPDDWQIYYYSIMDDLADAVNAKAGTEDVKTIEEMTAIVENDLVNTSSGDATAADIRSGKIAWVDGREIVGTASGSDINNLVGYSTVYLDTYHITYPGTGAYFHASYGTGPEKGDVYLEWILYNQTLTINGHSIDTTAVLQAYSQGLPVTPLCYYDDSDLYWVQNYFTTPQQPVQQVITNVTYNSASYVSLFANTEISYGDFSKTSNLLPNNIKNNVVVGADATVHNAGVLGNYTGDEINHDLTRVSIININTYDTMWLSIFENTLESTEILSYSTTHSSGTCMLWIDVDPGDVSISGQNINYTKRMFHSVAGDPETTDIAYYDGTRIYWVSTTLNTHSGTVENVNYADSSYYILFSAEPVAFGGFLVNTAESNIREGVRIGNSGNVNQGILGTLGDPLHDLVNTSVFYIDTYSNTWRTLATNTTFDIVSLDCNCGPDLTDPVQHDYLYTDDLSWSSYSGSAVNVNGFTVNPTKVLYYHHTYYDVDSEVWREEDTSIAYYDGTKIYWVIATIYTSGSVVSVLYANANYKSLFANASVSYGSFVYKDNNLIPQSIQENIVVGDLQYNAGIKGTFAGGASDIHDLTGCTTVYIDTYSFLWDLDYIDTTTPIATFTTSQGNYVLEWQASGGFYTANGYQFGDLGSDNYVLYLEDPSNNLTAVGYYTEYARPVIEGYDSAVSIDPDGFRGSIWPSTSFRIPYPIISATYATGFRDVFAATQNRAGLLVDTQTDPSNLLATCNYRDSLTYNAPLGIFGTIKPSPDWLGYATWSSVEFNTQKDWNAVFADIESYVSQHASRLENLSFSMILGEIKNGPMISIARLSSSIHILGIVNSLDAITPIYSDSDIDITVSEIHLVAHEGWNATSYPLSGSNYGVVTGFSAFVQSLDGSVTADFPYPLLPTLQDFSQIWSGKRISFGDFIDLNNLPSRTLTITSNGEYNVKDLLQYDKVVFANVGSVSTPTVSSTHGLTDNQLNFNDDFTYSVNNDLKLGVDATVSGDDLTFTE